MWMQRLPGRKMLTCLLILIVSVVVLVQISSPHLSVTRIIFGVFYGGVSVAICILGLSFVFVRRRI